MVEKTYSWCDKLAAVPAVGFMLDPHFASGASIFTALSPILDPLMDGQVQKFTMDKIDAFSAQFTTEDGFQYGVDQNRVHVTFLHRMKAKPVSLGPPIMEMLSDPKPYTQLLPSVARMAIDATTRVPSPKGRKVLRVGVVAQAAVDEDDLPPGIILFLKHLRRPWEAVERGFAIQITSRLGERAGVIDRCVHTLARVETPGELMNVSFDFQRTYAAGQQIDAKVLDGLFQSAKTAALQYFEELAEGNRFDEDSSAGN
jgi:hypothetical protein